MNALQNVLQFVSYLFRWWFSVMPWEQGVRVRAGKQTRVYGPGIHFVVPFVDRVFVQNTRMRLSPVPAQTISTADGKTLTLCGSLSYRIESILTMYQTLHQAEETLGQQVVSFVLEYVASRDLKDCTPHKITDAITEQLDLERYGLKDGAFILTDLAVVRSYRVINEGVGHSRWVSDRLDTSNPAIKPAAVA